MSYILIEFSDAIVLEEVAAALDALDFMSVAPNWHDAKVARMRLLAEDAGVSLNSAPFQALLAEKERAGATYGLCIETERAISMSGQLRMAGLLVGSRLLDQVDVESDANVASMISLLESTGYVTRLEIM